MNTKEAIAHEIEQVPEPLLEQVLEFLLSLKSQYQQEKLEITMMSESSLAKDWLSPEEDEAWQDL
ncbi:MULTISPECIES: DUF2281 domain-containing protein [unclassified Pseudanabaena]|jgi:hypothetical protein|uniref:DUF2281 domain-containing protein n=1 Tax=Pseudanabaena frigida TaxID=945775 RepID=A0A2W4WE86_9CYAN|nr:MULTISPECIES: DUF2281 domain-containing protein [unclassified Pseudanabaena]PZO43404.1 MAG: DUF2281 domain-containing protein [Pseudanabaena frigida]TYQ26440.1 DUF2281 domain-containing protein [Pseudanabaena sp. UWO311]